MKALDYVPAPVAFAALLVSLGGPFNATTGGQLTLLGWATLGLGAAAMVAALVLTRRAHRELDAQASQRRHLREIADAEVRLALKQITWPFFTLFGDDTEESMHELVPEHIQDATRLTAVVGVDIRSKDRAFPGGTTFDISWAEVLKLNADSGTVRLDRAMQIYAGYLAPPVMEALSEVRTSEFLFRLQRLDEHVEKNTQVAHLEFPFVRGPWEFGFGQFWEMVRKLDGTLTKDLKRLRRRM